MISSMRSIIKCPLRRGSLTALVSKIKSTLPNCPLPLYFHFCTPALSTHSFSIPISSLFPCLSPLLLLLFLHPLPQALHHILNTVISKMCEHVLRVWLSFR